MKEKKFLDVKIVGSSDYGRFAFSNAERTYNMFIFDDTLVPFYGYKKSLELLNYNIEGRGLFVSIRGGFLIVVIGSIVYRVDEINSIPMILFTLGTDRGDVYIDENLSSQICIVANPELWIYNYTTNTFGKPASIIANTDLVPNYVTFQNTFFIIGNGIKSPAGSQWFVYEAENPVTNGYELTLVSTLTLQTKPDYAVAAVRIPGKGNNLLVFGTTVAEIWTQVGGLQNYQKNSSINIDYGCVNVSTIASSGKYVAWLGINENSYPFIVVMSGGEDVQISTSGIDQQLDMVKFPQDSTAFFFRQNGHLFYQLTFYNPEDNFTLVYDFDTKAFFDLTDWDFKFHPARKVAQFKGQSYFISLIRGNLYEMNSTFNTYNVDDNQTYEIPRVRICNTLRLDVPEKMRFKLFTFWLESGTQANFPVDPLENPRIDVSLSKNGGITFGNVVPYLMHSTGDYKCQPIFRKLGTGNQLTIQMRFWGTWRFLVKNGKVEVSL